MKIDLTNARMHWRASVHANRRPVVLTTISIVCLALHYVLLRCMAHGHVAHALLGSGNGPTPAGAAILAAALILVRFVSVMLVPGFLLAAAAELVAYWLVGPTRADDLDDPLAEVDDDG